MVPDYPWPELLNGLLEIVNSTDDLRAFLIEKHEGQLPFPIIEQTFAPVNPVTTLFLP
jgi:hypothetical protein